MCGIFGYIGSHKNLATTIIQGLRSLEYRGYDAAGIGSIKDGMLQIAKANQSISTLAESMVSSDWTGDTGIGHVRWLTNGGNTHENAHPHTDCRDRIMLVHNGIVENDEALRKALIERGHAIRSETDSELIAHLIEEQLPLHPEKSDAIRHALKRLIGTYALAICFADEPGTIYAARLGSPLVIGINDEERFVSSDAHSFSQWTTCVIELEEQTLARITRDDLQIVSLEGDLRTVQSKTLDIPSEVISKETFPHFMLKEIHEQSSAIARLIAGRFTSNGTVVNLAESNNLRSSHVAIVACGTARHASLVGARIIEAHSRIRASVFHASEFTPGPMNLSPRGTVIAVSQSGETRDTIEALERAKRVRGIHSLAIVNAVHSSLARQCDSSIQLRAGIEMGVAATKTFTSQVLAFMLLTLSITDPALCVNTSNDVRDYHDRLQSLPELVASVIESLSPLIATIASESTRFRHALFLGRGLHYPIALEGALKLTEIAYVPSLAYPSGEMKHGPIALVDPHCLSVIIMPFDGDSQHHEFPKNRAALLEISSRGGQTLVITTESAPTIVVPNNWTIRVPDCDAYLLPVLSIIPLQLLAYFWSVALGYNPDQPRNLAKSVTVG